MGAIFPNTLFTHIHHRQQLEHSLFICATAHKHIDIVIISYHTSIIKLVNTAWCVIQKSHPNIICQDKIHAWFSVSGKRPIINRMFSIIIHVAPFLSATRITKTCEKICVNQQPMKTIIEQVKTRNV